MSVRRLAELYEHYPPEDRPQLVAVTTHDLARNPADETIQQHILLKLKLGEYARSQRRGPRAQQRKSFMVE